MAWRQIGKKSKPEAMNVFVRVVAELHPEWWKWPALGLVEAEEEEGEEEMEHK
ncbi:hypothetical protein T492DRAFT_889539 [Pavlovales sp. CCMP2436]|nr:hypothetical protein T492DRAFT_889539 [Pavlovales sp. CCMP2436]